MCLETTRVIRLLDVPGQLFLRATRRILRCSLALRYVVDCSGGIWPIIRLFSIGPKLHKYLLKTCFGISRVNLLRAYHGITITLSHFD